MGVVTGGGGGAAFNGGTITRPLTVNNVGGSATALTVRGDGADNAAEFYTDASGSYAILDSNSHLELFNALGAFGRVIVDDIIGGQAVLDSGAGIVAAPGASDQTALIARVGPGTTAKGATIVGQGSVGGFALDLNARPVLQTHSAPADASLAAGDCALWFDQTDGAAKLMVKGKSANGTVVAAAIALS
jgi:hypothetical protein